ncbi:MAG: hypothetical protein ACLFUG_13100, partial [Nitriliruptoraceae bacterium]
MSGPKVASYQVVDAEVLELRRNRRARSEASQALAKARAALTVVAAGLAELDPGWEPPPVPAWPGDDADTAAFEEVTARCLELGAASVEALAQRRRERIGEQVRSSLTDLDRDVGARGADAVLGPVPGAGDRDGLVAATERLVARLRPDAAPSVVVEVDALVGRVLASGG